MQQILGQKYRISQRVLAFAEETEREIAPILERYKRIKRHNSLKVLSAFHQTGVEERHFMGSTGYGLADAGRDKLAEVFAAVFGGEDAIVSPLFSSGTHTICTGVFGLLRPLDTMLCVSGRPYDTLVSALGIDDPNTVGGLSQYAIKYKEVPLGADDRMDTERIIKELALDPSIKMVYIQRSKGYESRDAFTIRQMEEVIGEIRKEFPDVFIFVDNCYGEFTEKLEPTQVGADVIAGSLIKNPGAGIAPTGGYIVGTKRAITPIAARFTTPATGVEIGSYTPGYRAFFQGLFYAPGVVYTALKGAILFAKAFSKLGYEVCPEPETVRADLPQCITFHKEDELIHFVEAVQAASPIDHHAVPIADDQPGYDSKIIMASGSFNQGSTIELSADAPIRPPYTAYFQGGLTDESIFLALCLAIEKMGLVR